MIKSEFYIFNKVLSLNFNYQLSNILKWKCILSIVFIYQQNITV